MEWRPPARIRTLVGVRYPARRRMPSTGMPRAASAASSPSPDSSSPTTPTGSGRPPSAATLATALAPPPGRISSCSWRRMSTGASRLMRFGVPVTKRSTTRSTSISTGRPSMPATSASSRSVPGVSCRMAADCMPGDRCPERRLPLARRAQHGERGGLGAAGLGLVPVLPARLERQRHQDALDAPAGAQAEARAAVVHQVELDVAAAAQPLPPPLALAPRRADAPADQRQVGGHEGGRAVRDEGEEGLAVAVAQVVEEDPSHAASLAAVGEVEVLVAPALEPRVEGAVVAVAGGTQGGVEVARVLLEEVDRRQVGAAAEPPAAVVELEVAVVAVHDRHERGARVQDHREADGGEAVGPRIEVLLRHHRREGVLVERALHGGDVDAGLVEAAAVLQHPRQTAAALGMPPRVLLEGTLLEGR